MNIQHKIPLSVNFWINLTPILIINYIFISLHPFTVTIYFTVLDYTNLFHGSWLYKFISRFLAVQIYFMVIDCTNLFHSPWRYKFISWSFTVTIYFMVLDYKFIHFLFHQNLTIVNGHNQVSLFLVTYNNNLFHRFLAENKKLELTVINFSSFVVDWLAYRRPEHWQVTMNLVVVAAAY